MERLKAIIFGSLVVGSLIASAAPALARVEWRDIENDRARLRMNNDELALNRRQLDLDLERRASPYQLDRDHRAIEKILEDRKSTRLNSSHIQKSRMPSSA